MRPLPWRRLFQLAGLATLLMVSGVLLHLESEGGNVVGLIQPGAKGPSAPVFAEDFPDTVLPGGIGHDGQQFYAIARNPLHWDEVADHLDRPQYRLQRPLFPLLAWALHPTGGGSLLILAFFVVGTLAVFLLGLFGGALSIHLGGGIWPAFLLPLLPGSFAALRITLADTLALALALGALLWAERGRAGPAAVAAIGAVLAKESILLLPVVHALARRRRAAIAAAVAAVGAAGTWWLLVHLLVDADERQVVEFTWPFGGVIEGASVWLEGRDLVAAATVVGAFLLAVVALWRRGRTHPLFGPLLAVTVFSVFLGPDVLGPDYNGSRTVGPVLVLAILVLGSPSPGVLATDSADTALAGAESAPV